MKKLLITALLMFGVYFATAIDATFLVAPNAATAKTSNYVNGPLLITALQFVNGSITLPNVITVYDSPQTNSTLGPAQGYNLTHYSNGLVVEVLQYITNRSIISTGFSGATFTNTERFVHSYTNHIAPRSNEFRKVWQVTVPAGVGQTVTIPIADAGFWFARGLTVSNDVFSTNIQINVSYLPGL